MKPPWNTPLTTRRGDASIASSPHRYPSGNLLSLGILTCIINAYYAFNCVY